MPSPLGGRNIVVTRPAEQALGLVRALRDAGANPIEYPLLRIEPADTNEVVELAKPVLSGGDMAIFVSPNAVRYGLLPLRAAGLWPSGLEVHAVGQGTARAIAAAGLSGVRVPSEGFDSEALLALPELSAASLAGRTVLLFKGEGGRPLLADTIAARGAQVISLNCYRRLPPEKPPRALLELADPGALDAIVITSSEALEYLGSSFGVQRQEALRDTLLVATHERIADAARRAGYRRLLVTAPGDDAVLAALRSYNWPPTMKRAP
jgi:uroporphyrinogen-III synthase